MWICPAGRAGVAEDRALDYLRAGAVVVDGEWVKDPQTAPGTRDSVIGMNVVAPPDTAHGVFKGYPYHVDMTMTALGP